LGSSPGDSFVHARVDLRFAFAGHAFDKFLRFGKFLAQVGGLFFQPLDQFFGLAAIFLHLFFPLRSEFGGGFGFGGEAEGLNASREEFFNFADAGVAHVVNRGEGLADGFVHLLGDGNLHGFLRGLLELSLESSDEAVGCNDHALR